MFKKKRSIDLPCCAQGLIYFYCANYKRLSPAQRKRIDKLCDEIGGQYGPALRSYLIHPEESAISVSMKYFVPEKKVYNLRAKFYKEFWERGLYK